MVSPATRLAEPLDVVISDGTSLSAATSLAGRILVGIYIPASWTAANISFQAANNVADTFVDVYNTSGSEFLLTGAASSVYLPVDPINFYGVNAIKVRSGTTATPVNQSGDITLTLMLAPATR